MADLRFDWDLKKAAENRRKHRVSFEEAQTAFLDEETLVMKTPITRKLRTGSSCSVLVLVSECSSSAIACARLVR